jgi:hypothetical protein
VKLLITVFLISVMCVLSIRETLADIITPVAVRSTSQFGGGAGDPAAARMIDGSGLSGIGPTESQVHDSVETNMWITGCSDGGIPGGSPEEAGTDCSSNGFAISPFDEQIVEFELDTTHELVTALIWNYSRDDCCANRALRNFELLVSSDLSGGFTSAGNFELLQGVDGDESAQVLDIEDLPGMDQVRRVRFRVIDNYDESYVGLSEVRFDGISSTPPTFSVSRAFSAPTYTGADSPIDITLDLTVLPGTGPFDVVLTETLPENWTPTIISNSGSFADGAVSWSLTGVDQNASLTYTLTPDDNTKTDVVIDGNYTLDGGDSAPITGQNRLVFVGPGDPAMRRGLSRQFYNENLPTRVTLEILIDEGAGPFDITITEDLPAQWTATDISDSGSFAGGEVSWSLTGVAASAEITYTLVPPATADSNATIVGTFTFDASTDRPVTGEDTLEYKVFFEDGIITPSNVATTSQFGLGTHESIDLIDGAGLDGIGAAANQLHDNVSTHIWLTGCVDGGLGGSPQDMGTDCGTDPFAVRPVNEEILEFELDTQYDLSTAIVWQFNEWNEGNEAPFPTRGVQNFEMLVSETLDGDDFIALDIFDLDQEIGLANNTGPNLFTEPAQLIEVDDFPAAATVRRVRFALVTSWSDPYAGLGEVRFEGVPLNAAPVFRRGDHDGSGIVDITDSLNSLGFLFLGQTPPICLDASDADNSGAVDISDSLNSLGFLFLGSFPLDATLPGPVNCGTDPTEPIDPDGPGGFPEQPAETLGCKQYPSEVGVACP